MNKLVKKITAVALSAVMVGGLFAGCSSQSGTAEKKEAKTSYKVGICQLAKHDALDAATKGFEDKLTEMGKEKGITFDFDFQNAGGDPTTCSTITNKFVSSSYDLIMANGTAALNAAATATVASKTPVVGTSITDYGTALKIDMASDGATGINVTGSSDIAPLATQAEELLKLFPKAKKVGCLYCSSEANSKFQVDEIKKALEAKGVQCTFYSFTDSNDIQAVALTAAKNSDVIYVPTDNTAASNGGVIDAACTKEKTPIYAGEDGIFKNTNAVATLSISFYEIGQKAGEYAYDILVNGKDPATMNIYQTKNLTYVYNKDKAKEFNVTIPDNYVASDAE